MTDFVAYKGFNPDLTTTGDCAHAATTGQFSHAATTGYNGHAADSLDAFDIDGEMPLDGGIRRYVLILRSQGIETFESCEGGDGHAYPEPTVRFHGNAGEGYRAFSIAITFGLPVLSVRRTFDVDDGWLVGPWWEMTFRTKDMANRCIAGTKA